MSDGLRRTPRVLVRVPHRLVLALGMCCLPLGARTWAAPPASPEVERLVGQLGSARYAEREAAAKRLEEIGERAWGALRQAVATSEDPEIRHRAKALAEAIESRYDREVRRFVGHQDRVTSVAFSADGRRALSGSGGKPRPDGRWLPGSDFTVRLWDVESGQELRRLRGHR